MHTVHAGFSISVAVKSGQEQAVQQLLEDLNKDPGNNPKIPFAKSPTTHFVNSVLLPAQDSHGKLLPPTLMLMTSYTGPRKVHLDELVRIGGDGLRELFGHCVGYQSAADTSDDALKRFMKKHRRADTFYTGMQYITHADIGREEALREAIETFVDDEHDQLVRLPPMAIRGKIQEFVKSRSEFAWAMAPWKKSFMDFWMLFRGLIFFLIILATLVLSPILWLIFKGAVLGALAITFGSLLAIIVLLILVFRLNELRDHPVAGRNPDAMVRSIQATQNHPVINEMTVAGPLKKGWIRPVFIYTALRTVVFLRGLMYIPTVATARWVLFDGGRRLLFMSNFANLSTGYVRDFIDSKKRGSRINILFGQGYAYPTTKWVIGLGAIDNPNGFMDVVSMNQHRTQFWYWPYRHLSIDNININRKIRLGLYAEQTPEETAAWLQYI